MDKNLANERARFAFDSVSEVKASSKDFSKYRSLVRTFPPMILRNGYGAAITFLSTSTKNENRELYLHISKWLNEQDLLPDDEENLMKYISQNGQDTYRLFESETMALLEWLKRFAEGMDAK